MNKGKYYAVPLHIHSCFEMFASMRGHMYQASRLGIEYMWITDHDFLMGNSENWIDGFSFAEKKLEWSEAPEITDKKMKDMFELFMPYGTVLNEEQYKSSYELIYHNLRNVKGFRVKENQENCNISADDGVLHITAKSSGSSEWERSTVEFYSSGARTQYTYRCAMLSGLTFKFPLEFDCLDNDIRVSFCGKMSQQYPTFEHTGIKYIAGSREGLENEEYTKIFLDHDGEILLNISDDAEKYVKGGLDNSMFDFWIDIEVRNGKTADIKIGDIEIKRKYENDDVVNRQRELAKAIGKEYGVTPIVTNEITAAGQHKISFSTKVPVIDYNDGPKDHDYAVAWVKKHGGIFSLNHPFFDWMRVDVKPCDKPVIIEKYAQHYIENKCWGATMMEVGFPMGRDHFDLAEYLLFWDKLSAAGQFITGYGDSDNHNNKSNWFDGNNFCAFIYAENPGEEGFIESMKSGNLYSGDPAQFRGEVSFETEDKKVMGKVIETEEDEKTVYIDIKNAPENVELVWVIDGVRVSHTRFSKDASEKMRVPLTKDINFVRVELYNSEGRCIMLTNPIYFTKKGKFEIPAERL